MVFLSSFSLVPYPWFQALACLGLRKPHSRLSQALAVVLTSKVRAESEGNSSAAETRDSKHWHQYVQGESRTWHQAVQTVLSWSGFRKKKPPNEEVGKGRVGGLPNEFQGSERHLKKEERTDQSRCVQTEGIITSLVFVCLFVYISCVPDCVLSYFNAIYVYCDALLSMMLALFQIAHTTASTAILKQAAVARAC